MNLYNTGASLTNSLDMVANRVSLLNPDGSLNAIYTTADNAIKIGGLRIMGSAEIGNPYYPAYYGQELTAYGGIESKGIHNEGDFRTDGDLEFNTATTSTNLTTALASKANLSGPTFTGTVGGITKTMVGLGNVENTTDLNKVISTATQTALATKAN
jgi:hypothetical protein